MDAADDQRLLLAGSSVPVTEAIVCAYAHTRPCVVFAEVVPDSHRSTGGCHWTLEERNRAAFAGGDPALHRGAEMTAQAPATGRRWTVAMDRLGPADASSVGGKAANLGELVRAGSPCPYSLPRWRWPASAPNSRTVDDAADTSFAGIHESYTDVVGDDALIDAGSCIRLLRSTRKPGSVRMFAR